MLHTNTFRRLAFAAALFLTVGISSSFAAPADEINTIVKTAFQKDFNKAELMASETGKSYTKLTFRMNGSILYAFYADNGDLLAVTRNIQSTQLPLQLLGDLKKNYSSYWISDLFELSSDNQSNYYITLENADAKVTLRSTGTDWDLFEKTSKK